ncbi:hypothetical protein CDO25_10820 [Sinorhizobium meliloti]|nr:hypothetical protein CDO25_10820 [Sinorhizobium meliloti]
MIPHIEFEHLPEDHTDLLENSGISKAFIPQDVHVAHVVEIGTPSEIRIAQAVASHRSWASTLPLRPDQS